MGRTKPGEIAPRYEEVNLGSGGGDGARYGAPWWKNKKVWIGVAAVVIIAIVIGVAVGVTQGKKSSYPDYSQLSYTLKDTFQGENFFDNFNYFTGFDPAQGFVHYVPEGTAKQLNLTFASQDAAVLKVDTSVGPNSVPNASTGRFSVRVESKNTYNDGLFIFDVRHTPTGCGSWPALWLTDPSNWPKNGEIDIMEATNQADDGNQMTLHTSPGCSMGVTRKQADKTLNEDCDSSKDSNAGCGVQGSTDTFGSAYNKNGGGIMAMEWRDAGIRVWQFARSAIPSDITSQKPDPSTWGEAAADFPSTDCNVGNHFRNNSIILNIDLCGDLVYGVWDKSGCSSNCTDIVANSPESFSDAYWEVGKFQVYQAS
ncbi:glycoside hydrolase family 16 protein [Trichoderma sp. SZMC 28014]